MNQSSKLTVKEALNLPSFESANIIAGEEGLENVIRWVHVMEVTQISHLLNGHELILTTGLGWQENKKLSLSLIEQMIANNVSGLCIELGTYIQEIPEVLIDIANEHNFPLIAFEKEVRFIDITKELNEYFFEFHNQMMVRLESISNQFNRLLLHKDGFQKILRLLHKTLQVQVAYLSKGKNTIYYPSVSNEVEERIKEEIKEAKQQSVLTLSTRKALEPVEAMGMKFADLVILSKERPLDELDFLVLDRAATALSQDQLRTLYVEERQRHASSQWIQDWIKGQHDMNEINEYLHKKEENLKINDATICVIEPEHNDSTQDTIYDSIIFTSIFKQYGFTSFQNYEQDYIVFVLINNRSKNDWKERLLYALEKIKKEELNEKLGKQVHIGVGKLHKVDQVHNSLNQAHETIRVKKKEMTTSIFYEDLYIYRIILELEKQKIIQDYIHDYLSPLLEENNNEMLDTLKVLLSVNGSRKEAAEKLFIVRQTLYHRIDKLKKMLGEDFMEGNKRLALEFAIHANEFLNAE